MVQLSQKPGELWDGASEAMKRYGEPAEASGVSLCQTGVMVCVENERAL